MVMFFRYATIEIPAHTPLKRCVDHMEETFCIPLSVRARIPAYIDGRIRGSDAVWVFTTHSYAYYLNQKQGAQLQMSNVEIRRVQG